MTYEEFFAFIKNKREIVRMSYINKWADINKYGSEKMYVLTPAALNNALGHMDAFTIIRRTKDVSTSDMYFGFDDYGNMWTSNEVHIEDDTIFHMSVNLWQYGLDHIEIIED